MNIRNVCRLEYDLSDNKSKQRELKNCLRLLRLINSVTLSRTKSELRAGQVHEVMDKRLLTATPKERKRLIFADNSYNVYVDGVGVGVSSHGNWRVRFRYLICCWFKSFALQNLQAFSKYKVTNVMYTLSWSLFLLWESVYTSVIYKRIRSCIVFQIFP